MPGLLRDGRSRSRGALRLTGALAVILLVASCGGGGGEDGGGGGSAYSLSTSSVTFSATLGGVAPAPQTVTITVHSGSVYVATSQSGGGFSHFLTITGQTTGQITILPGSPSTAGTFVGQITVRGCSSPTCDGSDVAGSPKTIDVTYTVAGPPVLTSSVATVDFRTLTGATPAARTLQLGLSSGSAAWTSSIAYVAGASGWLQVSPASAASLPQTITLSVLDASTAGNHTANVTFTAGALTKVVPVTLSVSDPTVNFVAPYVGTTGVAGNVIIRGYGFSSAGLTVDFGVNPATAATWISDTEIHATYPALPAGSYAVNVGNGGPSLATRANLVIADAPAFPAATAMRQNNPGLLGNLIYDAERRAVYLMDADRSRLEAFRYVNATGQWVQDATTITGSGCLNCRIALSPDGTELLMTSGGAMRRIDPATLAQQTPVDATAFLGTGGARLNLIAFGNDGGAVGSASAPATGISLYRYDMLARTFSALSTRSDLTNRTIVASGDADTLLLPTFESLAAGFEKPLFTYDASAGTLTQRSLLTTSTSHVSLSRTGSRVILTSAEISAQQTTTVYDGAFVSLGRLPADVRAFVISPDGGTAYAYFSTTGTIRKFDLNGPTVGGVFQETGSVAVDSPGNFFSEMAISPDGGTLFLAGSARLIVQPAP